MTLPTHPHPLWSNLFRRRDDWRTQATTQLLATPLFAGIPARTVRALVEDMYHRHYLEGETVFGADDPGLGMYLVLSGQVEIHLDGHRLALLGEGDFFGEVALFGEERRTASARALGETQLVGFFRPALQEWLARSPKAGANFLLQLGQILAQRLSRTNERLHAAEVQRP